MREDVLLQILNSPASSEIEKSEALAELSGAGLRPVRGQELGDQARQDLELDSSLNPDPRLSTRERAEAREQLTPMTQQLLNDFGDTILGGPPSNGATERLTALLARTGSDVVRQHVTLALQSITYYQEHEPQIRERLARIPARCR
jgi:hypothetical protein